MGHCTISNWRSPRATSLGQTIRKELTKGFLRDTLKLPGKRTCPSAHPFSQTLPITYNGGRIASPFDASSAAAALRMDRSSK